NIKIEVMDKQLQMQNENYKKLNEYLNETSRLRHDMRHHMHVIADFARNSNFEEINRYITSFEDENMLRSEAPVCKNKTVDVILRHYMGIAAGGGVDVKLQVDLPKELSISDTELCVIFGNLAENAQEACLKSQEKRAFIDIKAYVRGSQLIMCFSNSYSGEIHREEKNFFSTKHAGVGIGISSVMAIAKRHGGDVKITTENNIFKAYVMLNLE
ncbi:MAG: ATP-binding protein, partial [Oscillospiraceae bacterium]